MSAQTVIVAATQPENCNRPPSRVDDASFEFQKMRTPGSHCSVLDAQAIQCARSRIFPSREAYTYNTTVGSRNHMHAPRTFCDVNGPASDACDLPDRCACVLCSGCLARPSGLQASNLRGLVIVAVRGRSDWTGRGSTMPRDAPACLLSYHGFRKHGLSYLCMNANLPMAKVGDKRMLHECQLEAPTRPKASSFTARAGPLYVVPDVSSLDREELCVSSTEAIGP